MPGGKITGLISGEEFGSIQDRYMWHFKSERAAPEPLIQVANGLELWLDATDATTMTVVMVIG